MMNNMTFIELRKIAVCWSRDFKTPKSADTYVASISSEKPNDGLLAKIQNDLDNYKKDVTVMMNEQTKMTMTMTMTMKYIYLNPTLYIQ